MTFGGLEQKVVIPFTVERRVKVDKVNALVLDTLPQHFKIITEEKLSHDIPKKYFYFQIFNFFTIPLQVSGVNPAHSFYF
jgi:hypothetical protein